MLKLGQICCNWSQKSKKLAFTWWDWCQKATTEAQASEGFQRWIRLPHRAASNVESINEASKNLKSLWSTIKSLLHSSLFIEQLSSSGGPKMLLKVDCLPNAVGKQPSIPLIYLGSKWTLNWWWWWWWWWWSQPLANFFGNFDRTIVNSVTGIDS